MSKVIMSLVLAFATLIIAQVSLISSAQAAPPDYCHFYAQTAMRQLAIGLSNPACAPRLTGGRWSSDYLGHYNWCLWAPFGMAEAENFRRDAQLRACHWR